MSQFVKLIACYAIKYFKVEAEEFCELGQKNSELELPSERRIRESSECIISRLHFIEEYSGNEFDEEVGFVEELLEKVELADALRSQLFARDGLQSEDELARRIEVLCQQTPH